MFLEDDEVLRVEAPIMPPVNCHYTTSSRYETISITSSRGTIGLRYNINIAKIPGYQDVLVSFTSIWPDFLLNIGLSCQPIR